MSELAIVLRITALALIMLLGLLATVVTVVLAVWHGAGLRPRARRRRDDAYASAFGDFPLVDGSLGWTPGRRRVVPPDFSSAGFACPVDAAAMPIATADAGGDGASHPLGQTPPASTHPHRHCEEPSGGRLRPLGATKQSIDQPNALHEAGLLRRNPPSPEGGLRRTRGSSQ